MYILSFHAILKLNSRLYFRSKDKGITTICFTDHVYLNKNDYGYNYYSADGFWKKISEIKSNENQGIEILAGSIKNGKSGRL